MVIKAVDILYKIQREKTFKIILYLLLCAKYFPFLLIYVIKRNGQI